MARQDRCGKEFFAWMFGCDIATAGSTTDAFVFTPLKEDFLPFPVAIHSTKAVRNPTGENSAL
jgi:hypothetical protein